MAIPDGKRQPIYSKDVNGVFYSCDGWKAQLNIVIILGVEG